MKLIIPKGSRIKKITINEPRNINEKMSKLDKSMNKKTQDDMEFNIPEDTRIYCNICGNYFYGNICPYCLTRK